MNIDNNKKKIVLVLTICAIFVMVVGATYAGWVWYTTEEQKTNVVFTQTQAFSCAVDGGGDITDANAFIIPTATSGGGHIIKRKVVVTPTISQENMSINMTIWINVNLIDSGLSGSQYFRYTLTTSSTNKGESVVAYGNFYGASEGTKIPILYNSYSASTPETYYLYIWLGPEEDSTSTMNQSFSLSLGGECTEKNVTFGDVNLDGEVTDEDSELIVQHELKLITLSDDALIYADVNFDSEVSSTDAKLVMQYADGLISSLPVPCTYAALCSESVVFGDVNLDGIVNLADATLATQYSVGAITLSDEALLNCDVDLDEDCDSVDGMLILQYSSGKITSLPVF